MKKWKTPDEESLLSLDLGVLCSCHAVTGPLNAIAVDLQIDTVAYRKLGLGAYWIQRVTNRTPRKHRNVAVRRVTPRFGDVNN